MLNDHTVVITFTKLKPKKRDEQVTFKQQPTLQRIYESVEKLFEECESEDYELRCGKEKIDSEEALQTLCLKSKAFTIAVSVKCGLLHSHLRIAYLTCVLRCLASLADHQLCSTLFII
jgi:hypothetical protein